MKKVKRKLLVIGLIIVIIQVVVSVGYSTLGGHFMNPGIFQEATLPEFPDNPEMEEFIKQIHWEPYCLLSNNCFHKSFRIIDKAEELGMRASLILCITIIPMTWLWGWPSIQPHVYTIVEGKRVDVALDPWRRAQMYCVDRVIQIGEIEL